MSATTSVALPARPGGYPVGARPPFAAPDSMHTTPTDARSYSFPGPQDDQQWQTFPQPPSRAMSYGNYEGMQTTYVQAAPIYAPMQPQYLPQLDMQSVQMQQQITGPSSAPPTVHLQSQFIPNSAYVYTPQPGQAAWFPGQPYGSFGDGPHDNDAARRNQR